MKKSDKGFWRTLLAKGETNTISSKRLTMLVSLIMLVGLAVCSVCGFTCAPEFTYIFGSLVAAESGFTVIEKGKNFISEAVHDKHKDIEKEEKEF